MHLGLIPDGHRRYATNNNIDPHRTYLQGQALVNEIITNYKTFDDLLPTDTNTMDSLTIYLLSEENLNRETEEINRLYNLMENYLDNALNNNQTISDKFKTHFITNTTDLDPHKLNLRFITTNPDAIPDTILEKMKNVEQKFNGDELTVNFLTAYNGQQEIIEATNKIQTQTATKETLQKHLQIPHEIDYVIRTGNNPRRECLSGFPIWQTSYSEYYHLPKNFPAVTLEDLENAINHYTKLRRNNGK